MTRIAHISDLHIGEAGAEAAARRVVNAILDALPDVVIVSGDITDDGLAEQYERAYDVLRALIRPDCLLLVVPGNHDVGRRGISYDLSARARFAAFVEKLTGLPADVDFPFVYQSGDCRFICLDTCIPPALLARGRVGYVQRQRLAKELEHARRSGLRTVVVGHHHPFDRGMGLDLIDSPEILATLSGRTDLLLFGHKHAAGEWSNVYGIRRVLASCKSTSTLRYREIEIGDARISQRWILAA